VPGIPGRAVDAWRAFQATAGAEADRARQEGRAREVLTELFQEELFQSPDLLADLVVARLGGRGFLIIERERPEPPAKQ
jgi:hypothetical protein